MILALLLQRLFHKEETHMATKPELLPVQQLKELYIQQYDTAIPTAFDESLSLLEKVNKMILQLE